MGPCMCGDPGCGSCGPALGAPPCEYSTVRCGDPECDCATSTRHHDAEPDTDFFDPDYAHDEEER